MQIYINSTINSTSVPRFTSQIFLLLCRTKKNAQQSINTFFFVIKVQWYKDRVPTSKQCFLQQKKYNIFWIINLYEYTKIQYSLIPKMCKTFILWIMFFLSRYFVVKPYSLYIFYFPSYHKGANTQISKWVHLVCISSC